MIEFLDTEWRDYWVPIDREQWRRAPHGEETVLLPTPMVAELVQPERMNDIAHDDLDELTHDIKIHGFRFPLLVTVDLTGRAVLRDGHHRLRVCERLNIARVPVRFEQSERIRVAGGLPVAKIFSAWVNAAH